MTCWYCERAPAITCSVQRRDACGECAHSVAAFFRGEVPSADHRSAKQARRPSRKNARTP